MANIADFSNRQTHNYTMQHQHIRIRGARTHNLKNISVDIPRDKLIVFTGLSGSGKSSLAFDTIFAEGQIRYVESLSSYARQFLSVMEKPDVDTIEGLSPAISIEQKSASHNPRSTVGTVTEIYDYLRLLYARIGEPRCPQHQTSLSAQSISQIVDHILNLPEGTGIMLLAPVIRDRKGEYQQLFAKIRSQGFIRVRINQTIYQLDDLPTLHRHKKHTIEVVVDRLKIRSNQAQRLAESLEIADQLGEGLINMITIDSPVSEQLFSSRYACTECGYSLDDMEPKLFSFNNPSGACTTCDGLGITSVIDPERVIYNPELSLPGGAIKGWGRHNYYYFRLVETLGKHYGFDINLPFSALPEQIQKIILHGSGDEVIDFSYQQKSGKRIKRSHPFEGVVPTLERRLQEDGISGMHDDISQYISNKTCESCNGNRLNIAARHVFIEGHSLPEICALQIDKSYTLLRDLKIEGQRGKVAEKILKEVLSRLVFLMDVGLGYLTLHRSANTLSGGEAQRIRLASQIGAGLVGVLYVLDEPTIGLHPSDNRRLLKSLCRLRDLGNTVLMVEHDEEAILLADHVVDIGPGAGVHGGEIIAEGTPQEIIAAQTLTGDYLAGRRVIPIPKHRIPFDKNKVIELKGLSGNNLKNIDVKIPLGLMICVTGVSGSGKSTLVNDTLFPLASRMFYRSKHDIAPYKEAHGLEALAQVIAIDQSPIGRTPRSNPATYTGVFTVIRELFASTEEARARGYKVGRFSFNIKGGRCLVCEGEGEVKVSMHFLPDVYVRCDACGGQRYNRETLTIQYKGKNIHQVLSMTVEEAYDFFKSIPPIARRLETLMDVGLAYITLGQNAVSLSGGEAQRVKLSRELSKRDTGKNLYILDEPTTGLHFHDVNHLLHVLHRLRDHGNTVVVIEHNLDVIKTADWVIDLGPQGGQSGGEVIAVGTPENIIRKRKSLTGQFLKPWFKKKQYKHKGSSNKTR